MIEQSRKKEKSTQNKDSGESKINSSVFKLWNRKLHIYAGLYFLLFIWLFSISGLLLNNPEWTISNYWPEREITHFQKEIVQPSESGDLEIAKNLMNQLLIRGEIHETGWGDSEDEFRLQVRRPGQMISIETNFEKNLADMTEIRVNSWGVIRMLHTFTGAKNQTDEKRNWILTKIWSFSIDALAAGLIIMVFSGLYMWYLLSRKRIMGIIFLGLGTGCCLFFLFGITLFL
ncbi:MAG: PepSY-associated TM helix domain-containing protein [Balneolaceae bacterium]|nr:PepSY-associated TM helix domain-containing protein [Balneolaceae bacterium]